MTDRVPLYWDSTNNVPHKFNGTDDVVPVTSGGTGGNSISTAQQALDLEVGVDVQGFNTNLDAISDLTGAGVLVQTSTGAYALRALDEGTGITITNPTGAAGDMVIGLATLSDAGTGTFLKFTRDSTGRVSGSTAVVAGDITTLVGSIYAPIDDPTFTTAVTLPGAPTAPLHAATRQYVDDLFASGGIAPFNEVHAKSTADVNLANPGTDTFDTRVLTTGNRLLLNNQTDTSENGIYVFATSSTALTRATDADDGAEFQPARQVFVTGGSLYINTGWAVSSAVSPVVDTDPITFTQVSGASAYDVGNGLDRTGNTFFVKPVSGQIVVSGSGVGLATTVTGTTTNGITYDNFGRITSATALTYSDVGAQPIDATLTALAALNNTAGYLVQTGADTFVRRSLATASASRITISNPAGTAGDSTFDLATSGVGAGTYNSVTVDVYGRVTAGTTGSTESPLVTLTNGSGSSIAIGRAIYMSGSGSFSLANANNVTTAHAIGLVADTSIANSAAGNVVTSGVLSATTGQWDAVTGGSGGLVYDLVYFLSNATSGAITSTPPSSGLVVRLGTALSTTKLAVNPEILVYL